MAENSVKQHTLRKSTSAPNIRHCRTFRDVFETIPEVQCSANPSTVVGSDVLRSPSIARGDENEGKYLASLANNANENVDYSIGDRVIVNTAHQVYNKPGYIRFIGMTHIQHGLWYGVELDEPCGK